jgi:hypothetical protein
VADIAQAALGVRVLEHLGVLAAGATAAAADTTWVAEAVDAAHARLRARGLVPFPLTAIPSWAQIPLRDIAAADMAQSYGATGQRLLEFRQAAAVAEKELSRQVSGRALPVPTRGTYF